MLEGEGEESRRALMMLVRRTAPFQVETGRWRGVYTLGREFV